MCAYEMLVLCDNSRSKLSGCLQLAGLVSFQVGSWLNLSKLRPIVLEATPEFPSWEHFLKKLYVGFFSQDLNESYVAQAGIDQVHDPPE